MDLSGTLPQINLGVQGGLHSGAKRVNPEFSVGSNFRIITEQYFSGVKNVAEFLENIDNNLTYYEIPTQLACAYLKGHLTGRELDWFEVLVYRVVEDKVTYYAHLKQALTDQLPVIHKILKLEMTEEKLIDHIISRLEPQILDYAEKDQKFELEIPRYKPKRTIVSLTGIGRKIVGKRGVTIDTRTIADHGESSIDLRVMVLRIIGDSMVDDEVVNLITDSTIQAVGKVVRGTVLSGVRMIKTDI
ncbi:uncharacterized protein TNCV_963861 [Trichonephila clavipes]|nr:uncharacterized protein TNCV_963861 [Trichonephila clavipes]